MEVVEVRVSNYRSINKEGIKYPLGNITTFAGANDSGKTAVILATYLGFVGLFRNKPSNNINYQYVYTELNKHYYEDEVEGFTNVTIGIKFTKDELDSMLPSGNEGQFSTAGFSTGLRHALSFLVDEIMYFTVTLDELFHEHGQLKSEKIGFDWLDVSLTAAELPYKLQGKNGIIFNDENLQIISMDFVNLFIVVSNSKVLNVTEIFKNCEVIYIPTERYVDFSTWDRNPITNNPGDYRLIVEKQMGVNPRELVRLIETLEYEVRRKDYKRYLEIISYLYPIESISTKPSPMGGREIYITQKGRTQPIHRSGAGLTHMLYICARILEASYSQPTKTLILIDEPENGFHPGLQKLFVELMQKLTAEFGVHWIVATHSPFIFAQMTSNDRVISIKNTGSFTEAKSVDLPSDLFELHANIGFNIPSILAAKKVIFCEGFSEASFLPIVLKKIGFDLKKLGILIVPLGGANNLEYFDSESLIKLHPDSLLIIDWDHEGEEEHDLQRDYIENSVGLKVICNKEFRTLENTYPAYILQKVMGLEKVPEIQPFDTKKEIERKIKELNPKKYIAQKTLLAKRVAENMEPEDCLNHPLIQAMSLWLEK